MTLTTGLAPVPGPPPDAGLGTAVHDLGTTSDTLLRGPSGRRPIGWLVVSLDVLAGAVASVAGATLAEAWMLPMLASLVVVWPLAVAVAGGYGQLREDPYAVRARALLAAGGGLALLGWVVLALAPQAGTVSGAHTLAGTTLVLAAAAPLASAALRGVLPVVVPRRPMRTVLVGRADAVRELMAEADRGTRGQSFQPVAVCLPGSPDPVDPGASEASWDLPACHDAEGRLLDVVRLHRADAVVAVPGAGVGHAELRRWGAWLQAQGVDLLVSPELRDVTPARLGFASLGGTRLLRVRPAPLSGAGSLAKGCVDRVVAALLLLFLAPVLGVLALMVRSDSPGPALFRQTRVGRGGQLFTVYKLRTMCDDADHVVHELVHQNESDREGVLFKIKRDPRITRLGARLRTYSLDELPQLLNVVRGEMSLIGPRPALPREVDAYAPDLRRRLDVKPGMTGLWQVSGRSDLSWDDTVRLDLQYVDNWSWRMDAAIAVRTATAVLGHRGAY